jgi:hypothetical protein
VTRHRKQQGNKCNKPQALFPVSIADAFVVCRTWQRNAKRAARTQHSNVVDKA